MKEEKFVIMVETDNGMKFFRGGAEFVLVDTVASATKLDSENMENNFINIPCLRNKNPRIKSVLITYELR